MTEKIKILLTTFFINPEVNFNYQIYNDHYGKWLVNNLSKEKIDVKFLVPEIGYELNKITHILNFLNPVQLSDSDMTYIFGKDLSFLELYRKFHDEKITLEEICKIKNVLKKILIDWEPDIVIIQGCFSARKLWQKIFPNALCFTQENAIFSRPPFLRTLAYDPFNSCPESFLTEFSNEIKNFKITKKQEEKIIKFKECITKIIDRNTKLTNEMIYYKNKFRKLLLLPLTGQLTSIFNDVTFENEYNLIEYVMSNVPEDIGVFATRHDIYSTLTNEDIDYFSNKYTNFIFLQKTNVSGYASNSLNYFQYIDAVINITSKTGLLALLWDKPILSLANIANELIKDGQGMDDLDKVLYTPSKNKNNILYWYFTRYALFEPDFYKEGFLYMFLEDKLNYYRKYGINFDFYNEINDIDTLLDYTTQSIINYYNWQENKKNEDLDSKFNSLETKYNDLENKFSSLEKILSDMPTLLEQIFSIKNSNNHKILRLFGIKLKIKRKNNIDII